MVTGEKTTILNTVLPSKQQKSDSHEEEKKVYSERSNNRSYPKPRGCYSKSAACNAMGQWLIVMGFTLKLFFFTSQGLMKNEKLRWCRTYSYFKA